MTVIFVEWNMLDAIWDKKKHYKRCLFIGLKKHSKFQIASYALVMCYYYYIPIFKHMYNISDMFRLNYQ